MDERREAGYPKTASCACGALRVTAAAPPQTVHVCSCLACQRKTGSVFSYNAFFADAAVTITGEHRAWRGSSDAGRWNEVHFCPTCGSTVFSRLEALPGLTAVSSGCFADPGFQAPGRLYWATHRHRWLGLAVETVDIQDETES